MIRAVVVVAGLSIANVATASPGVDLVEAGDDCAAKIPNPELQAKCTKCFAGKGKHFHVQMDTCHAVKAPPPKPPIKIDGPVACNVYFAAPGQEATNEQCVACVNGENAMIWTGGKCVPEPDIDPKRLKTKAVVDSTGCSLAAAGKTENRLLFDRCSTCVKQGGTYFASGACNGPQLDASTPAVTDAKSCQLRKVAAERRLACKACLKQDFNTFVLVGNDAGQCVRDDWKFVDKFQLPDESVEQKFFYKRGSCATNAGGDKTLVKCLDCIRGKNSVMVGGECLAPAAAAKKARALGMPPAQKPATPPPAATTTTAPARTVKPGENLIVNGGFEATKPTELVGKGNVPTPNEWGISMQSIIDGKIALRGGARTGSYALELISGRASAETKLEPGKKYRATLWTKARDVGATAKLTLTIKLGPPGKQRSIVGTATSATKEWTQLAIDVEAAPTEEACRLEVAVNNPGAAGAFLVDDVELMLAP
jgi:hypothetical protein